MLLYTMKKSSIKSIIIVLLLTLLAWAQQDILEAGQSLVDQIITEAEQGNPSSQTMLGVMYERGLGVSKSAERAVKWIRKAASQGDTKGQSLLGRLYAVGYGVQKNENEALAWFHKGVLSGVERFSKQSEHLLFAGGFGGAIRSAEAGNVYAQSTVGMMYLTGVGVAQNDIEAVRWLMKAAEKGHAGGVLGLLYEEGRGGLPKDKKEAMRIYLNESEQSFQRVVDVLQYTMQYMQLGK